MFDFSGTDCISKDTALRTILVHSPFMQSFIYSTNIYRGPTTAKEFRRTDQQPLGAYLPDQEFFVPGTVAQWPQSGKTPSKSSPIFPIHILLRLVHKLLSSVHPERKQYVHAFASCKEVFPREVGKEKTDVSFQAFVLKSKITISLF